MRPSLSPLVWVAAAAWLGSRAGTEAALQAWLTKGRAPLLACAALALAVLVGAGRVRSTTLRWALIAGSMALALSFGRGTMLAYDAAAISAQGSTAAWTAIATSDAITGPFGTSIDVRLESSGRQASAQVNWPKGAAAPRYGEELLLEGRVRCAAPTSASAEAFRSGVLLRSSPWRASDRGPASSVFGSLAAWRNASVDRLLEVGGRGAEALASMLFAAKPQGPGVAALEDARAIGVAWLMTASGLQLGVIVLLAERLAGMCGAGRRGRTIATIATVCVVAVAAGLRLSLLRAAIAACAAVLGRLVGRRRDGTATLGVAVLVLVLADPAAAYDVGLSIAVIAVGAIAVLAPLARTWLSCLLGRSAAWALGASVVAQLAVAPLAAAVFSSVGLAGPVVLVVTGPLVQGAVAVGVVGAVIGPILPWAGSLLFAGAAHLADIAASVWAWVAQQPGTTMAVAAVPSWLYIVWAAAAAALWLRWPQPRRAARVRAGSLALIALLVAFGCHATPSGVVQVLDIGQGDAILIRDGGHAVLVDTGPDPAVLRQALARAGVSSLDGVVLTHAHADHTGGIDALQGASRPGWIGMPDVRDDDVDALADRCDPRTDSVLRLRRGMTFTVGRVQARVLWPTGGESGLAANDTSVILLLEVDGQRALLLGDAEDHAQHGALEAFRGTVDLLKVAHHGSMNGNVPEALSVWRPKVALISVGAGNKFGHPTSGALSELASIGAEVHRTDLEGDLAWDPATAENGSAAQANAATPLCDNRRRGSPDGAPPERGRTAEQWLAQTSAILNPSISSTAQKSCCSSAPRSGCATGWRPWPTSTSTSRPSTGARPPPTTSSTRPIRCRS